MICGTVVKQYLIFLADNLRIENSGNKSSDLVAGCSTPTSVATTCSTASAMLVATAVTLTAT
jgi:hypothetical protein